MDHRHQLGLDAVMVIAYPSWALYICVMSTTIQLF